MHKWLCLQILKIMLHNVFFIPIYYTIHNNIKIGPIQLLFGPAKGIRDCKADRHVLTWMDGQ